MIAFRCASCQKNLSVKDSLAGKKVQCPGCAHVVPVPQQAAVSPAPAEQPGTLPAVAVNPPPRPGPPAPPLTELPTAPPTGLSDATRSPHPGVPEHDAGLTNFLAPPQADGELGRLGGFRILTILGHGGMGVVFQGEDPKLGRKVALKAMLPHLAGSKSGQERFLPEARAAAALEHDHIVPIFHVGEERGAPFIVMPFLKGEPLDRRLQRDEALPIPEVLRIGREIAQGLAAAHAAGLIHRDIKPANIWLEAPKGRVKILDFGLARATSQEVGLTQQGAIVGTPTYMAPEQGRGETVDARCDLWALGVLLYRLCTGKLPFHGTDPVATLVAVAMDDPAPPAQANPEVPAGLSDLVMKLLAKDRARRLGSAQEVVEALRDPEQGQQATQVIADPGARIPRGPATGADATLLSADQGARGASGLSGRNRKPLLLALGGVLVVALVAGIVAFWPRAENPVPKEPNDPKGPSTGLANDPPAGALPREVTNSLGMKFALVPRGKAWLGGGGSKPGDKEVEIPHDFYLGVYEVTQE
jgi:hypothetical protein